MMRNARFWTGVAIVLGPLVAILAAGYVPSLVPAPTVRGRVLYHGRPVSGGWICFAAEDREECSDLIGRIDRDGYFSCVPRWWKPSTDRPRFRLSVVPDPRRHRGHAPDVASTPAADEGRRARADRDSDRPARVVLASFPNTPAPAAARETHGETTPFPGSRPLDVALDSASVYLDIDLKD